MIKNNFRFKEPLKHSVQKNFTNEEKLRTVLYIKASSYWLCFKVRASNSVTLSKKIIRIRRFIIINETYLVFYIFSNKLKTIFLTLKNIFELSCLLASFATYYL